MKRKIFGFLGAILIGVAAFTMMNTLVAPTEVAAAGGVSTCVNGFMKGDFLGFKAWYDHLPCNKDDEIANPTKGDENALKAFVWTIVLNVSFDLTVAIGYIAVAMVIYGGYLYIMSNGDTGKAQKAQKTLATAIVGVIIAMGASVIVNTVLYILGASGGYGSINEAATSVTFNKDQLKNVFNWAYSMAGLVAAIFIIKGGIDYTMSRGDSNKTQKATHSLIFAAIGLVIVILAAAITNFVISNVGKAMQ